MNPRGLIVVGRCYECGCQWYKNSTPECGHLDCGACDGRRWDKDLKISVDKAVDKAFSNAVSDGFLGELVKEFFDVSV